MMLVVINSNFNVTNSLEKLSIFPELGHNPIVKNSLGGRAGKRMVASKNSKS